MLPCVCSVIDHRWRQNVIRTKKWHTRRSRVCHWCSYHILTSSVIYYWIRRTVTGNLFVLYNNEKTFFISKKFNITRKPTFAPPLPRLCPAFAHKKKPFDVIYDLYRMKQFHWLLCVGRNCDWSSKNRATVKPDPSVAPRWKKTYSESRIELRNLQILKKMLQKSSHRSSPVSRRAWTLP